MCKYESATMLNETKTDHKKTLRKPEESILCRDAVRSVSSKACINKIINILLINQPLCLNFLLLYRTTENYILGKLKTCYCIFLRSLYFS